MPANYRKILDNIRVMAIGCGPTTLFPTTASVALGVRPSNVIGFTNNEPKWGGMWMDDKNGAGVEFNNPLPLILPHGMLMDRGEHDRAGKRMREFLDRIVSKSKLSNRVFAANVQSIIFEAFGYRAVLLGGRVSSSSDVVFAGLGNEPKSLVTSKMKTNAAQYENEIHRWQEPFTQAEAHRLNGKSVLIVGLGNSALRQINFVKEANQKYGVSIKTIILTHFTSNGINNPSRKMQRSDHTLGKVARDPKGGDLVNLELDLKKSTQQYFDFLKTTDVRRYGNQQTILQGILPSVTSWLINKNRGSFTVTATVSKQYERRKVAGDYVIENVGAIFVLGGYHTDPQKLQALGFQVDSNGKAIISPQDGALVNQYGEPNAQVFLTGFPSATEKTPNSGTMPGSIPKIADQMLAMILAVMAQDQLKHNYSTVSGGLKNHF